MRILLVEDNNSDAALLMEVFAGQKNPPSVHWVTDGHEALDFFMNIHQKPPSQHPDVILLDLSLPKIDGYGVLEKLKLHPFHAHIPVVVLTTSCSPLDHMQCKKLGCDKSVSKPTNLKGYGEMVERMLNVDFPKLLDRRVATSA